MQLYGVVNWLAGFAVEGIMHIFKTWIDILNTWRGRSLVRYDDGLQNGYHPIRAVSRRLRVDPERE